MQIFHSLKKIIIPFLLIYTLIGNVSLEGSFNPIVKAEDFRYGIESIKSDLLSFKNDISYSFETTKSADLYIDLVTLNFESDGKINNSLEELKKNLVDYTIPYYNNLLNKDFKIGYLDYQPLHSLKNIECESDSHASFISNLGNEFYARKGISHKNRYLFILAPRGSADCSWAGKSVIGSKDAYKGDILLLDYISPEILNHEFGHSFGLGHSNIVNCPSGKDAPLGDCKIIEYGANIDPMGNLYSDNLMNGENLFKLGILSRKNILSLSNSQSTRIYPTDFDKIDAIKAIYINNGGDKYMIQLFKSLDSENYSLAVIKGVNFNDGADSLILNLGDYRYKGYDTSGSFTSDLFQTYDRNVTVSLRVVGSQFLLDIVVVDPSKLKSI